MLAGKALKGFKMVKNKFNKEVYNGLITNFKTNKVSITSVDIFRLHRIFKDDLYLENCKNSRSTFLKGNRYFAHRDSNAAFNISALGKILYEQTSAQKVVGVRHIGGPLNWRSVKADQSESSGGAR